MTQPPQPPNEPPQGGFGAPQEPPAAADGAPQNPPPAAPPDFTKPAERNPGYGYPQTPPPPGQAPAAPPAPGTAPQAPPPPGQPPATQPAPPVYGYPGAPQAPPMAAGQQAYGYPGQQQYGVPQPPTAPMQSVGSASGGRRINAQMAIIVSAVVAIALIIGGGVWYSKSSGSDDQASSAGPDSGTDGKGGAGGEGGKDGGDAGSGDGQAADGAGKEKVPASTSANVLFQLPAPAVPDKKVWRVTGSWLNDEVYAKSGVNELVGYEAGTGKKSWTMPLDGFACAGSPEVTDDGFAAVVYERAKRGKKGDYQPCSKISAFNLNTGEKLWTKEVAVGDQKARYEEVSISGTTVAVGGGTDGGAAFDLKSGKALWTPQAGSCKDVGYRGGEQLVAVRKCGNYGNEKFSVQVLNAADGKPKWTYKLPDGIDNAKVISAKPVVFGVDSGEITASGVTDVFSLDDTGKLLTKITLEDGKYEHDCGVNKIHDCHAITVGNGRVYVPTKEHEGSGEYGRTNEIVSFSLTTGKPTGDRIDAGDKYTVFPIRMDGGNIIAYKDGPYDKGSQVVSVDGKSLKQTMLLETPASQQVLDALSSMVPKRSEMLYTNGRLFLGKGLISKPYSEDRKEYTAIGFGVQ